MPLVTSAIGRTYRVLFLLVFLSACDLFTSKDPPNPCEQAQALIQTAYTQACEGQQANCCFCQCWSDGKKDYDQAQYRADKTCKCLSAAPDRRCQCKDQQLAIAERCLGDEETCKSNAVNFVTGQAGLCTLTPSN